ncbi:ABC transporter substrate-binding protein [Candidatus Sumerlaeota bacterium]
MKKIALIFGAVIVVVAAVTVVLWQSRQTDDSAEINLRLKWLWYSGWAGELLAEEENIYRDNGLEVNTQPGGFEIDPIKLVAAGTDDIGIAGADQILFARKNGVPLVAFAVQYQESPVGFVSMEGSGIKTVGDFSGRKIGVKYGTDVEPIYRALLAQAGLKKEDVQEVPVKFDLTPFFSGAIDVYPGYLTNDLLLPEEKGHSVRTISAPDLGISVYGNVYFCREDYLGDNSDELVAFLEATKTAWIRALSIDPGVIADLALKKNEGLNREHEIRVVASLRPFMLTVPTGDFGVMTDDGWETLYSLLRQQGVIDSDFDYRAAYSLKILERLKHDK